ncbi:ABC transporter ATP-binding protein [Alicyclobacillus fastidiosus]|uniref:ABC transporter ATP-binding protein n=1 Tax=Alicyclobacillus fastidiosus TaxID=392011 RepID=UPI0023E9932E|nr:ABC transporter ATP-binding protein [Alicyclobacillus fastidiosus]GMA65816.1 oligopeptide transport ATP-binding protein OppD [Alicyclobacillus fastidiosus]GMA65888.1 oligopeptide transport ATP-binding protein OppD [Alicyclobacillus fastidiosus]
MLQIENLNVRFPTHIGTVHAVRGATVTVEPGQTVAIVGESGSGKSVTVQSVMRLLPKRAKIEGEILWKGKNLASLSEKDMQSVRGREIGMVFQDPMTALNPTMKIGKQIAEVLVRQKKMSVKQALRASVEILERVGIPDPVRRANNYPHEFSGGMRQRAVIAIAIACSPELLIADEPTTALDVTVQAQILDLLKDLQKETNMGLLLITHDLAVVSEVADKVAVMYAGRVIEQGPAQQVLMSPVHPYTRGLLESRPQKGQTQLHPIPGAPPDLLSQSVGCPFVSRCKFPMRICQEHLPLSLRMEIIHRLAG